MSSRTNLFTQEQDTTCHECRPKAIIGFAVVKAQGSTLRKNFISPAGLVTVTFTSPEIFFASPDINDNSFQIVTSVEIIASVDNMKRIQCIVILS